MILNELSINGSVTDYEEMKRVISSLVKLCQKIYLEKQDLDFYYTEELLTKELISGCTIHAWLQDPQVSQKEKSFFRIIINRRQLIGAKDFLGSELIVEDGDGNKRSAVGCLMAYEMESYVVSMNTSSLWHAAEISGTYISLEDEDRSVSVANCCFEEHLKLIEEKEKNRVKLTVSSGRELWEKREKLYPHLLFCDSVQEQLREARLSLHICMIMKRLQVLEDYFKDFDGCFDINKVGHGCRDESETVEKNNELRRLRIFRTPFDQEEYFNWHISFAGNFPGRIHFIPDAEHRVGIIGYIGKHLPTGKYSTI